MSLPHQCPKCELRFSFRSELAYHLESDHPEPAAVPDAPVKNDARPASEVLPVTPPSAGHLDPVPRGSARRRRSLVGLLLAAASFLLAVCVAVGFSAATAVVITVVLLVLIAIYVRRSRGRARLPRR